MAVQPPRGGRAEPAPFRGDLRKDTGQSLLRQMDELFQPGPPRNDHLFQRGG